MVEGDFGGLCENGHDVAAGARYCPSCGAPAHRPTAPTASTDPGAAAGPWETSAAPGPTGGPWPGGPWAAGPWPGGPWPGGPWMASPPPPAPGPHGHPWAPPPPGWYPYPPAGSPPPGWSGFRPGAWPAPPGYWAARPMAGRVNGLAVASLVLGILWLWWVGSILAVVFGHVALHQMRSGTQYGRALAVSGLVLGYVGLGAGLLVAVATSLTI